MNFIQRITQMSVLPEGEPLFSEHATTVKIEDDAGGEYLKIIQCRDDMESGVVAICPAEWPQIKSTVDLMMAEIAKHERKQ